MAKVHIVMKGYTNGASVVERAFSSKKRAQEWLEDFHLASAEKDGWLVVRDIEGHHYGDNVHKIIPPSGEESAQLFYIYSQTIL